MAVTVHIIKNQPDSWTPLSCKLAHGRDELGNDLGLIMDPIAGPKNKSTPRPRSYEVTLGAAVMRCITYAPSFLIILITYSNFELLTLTGVLYLVIIIDSLNLTWGQKKYKQVTYQILRI